MLCFPVLDLLLVGILCFPGLGHNEFATRGRPTKETKTATFDASDYCRENLWLLKKSS
jgi:hypothetical protein